MVSIPKAVRLHVADGLTRSTDPAYVIECVVADLDTGSTWESPGHRTHRKRALHLYGDI